MPGTRLQDHRVIMYHRLRNILLQTRSTQDLPRRRCRRRARATIQDLPAVHSCLGHPLTATLQPLPSARAVKGTHSHPRMHRINYRRARSSDISMAHLGTTLGIRGIASHRPEVLHRPRLVCHPLTGLRVTFRASKSCHHKRPPSRLQAVHNTHTCSNSSNSSNSKGRIHCSRRRQQRRLLLTSRHSARLMVLKVAAQL